MNIIVSRRKVPASMLRFVMLLLMAAACSARAQSMQPMSDEQLGAVSGREGVMVSMDYYYNTVKTDDLLTSGQADSSYCAGTLADTNCRLAWQIANRGQGDDHNGLTGANAEWLVYKNGYASLTVHQLDLDGSFLGDAQSAGASYVGWFDASTFSDSTGACLLTGSSGGVANCSVDYIKNMPALRTHYPGTSGTYDSANKTVGGYEDARFGLNIGGLAVEYGTTGYNDNVNGSFAAISISDNNGYQAGFAFGGSFYLYGF